MVEAMLIQFAPSRFLRWKTSIPPNKAVKIISYTPQLNLFPPTPTFRVRIHPLSGGARAQNHGKAIDKVEEIEADVEGQLEKGEEEDFSSGHEDQDDEEDYKAVEEEFSHASAYRARRDEKDYDRDPEIADILGSCFDDPKKAQSKDLVLLIDYSCVIEGGGKDKEEEKQDIAYQDWVCNINESFIQKLSQSTMDNKRPRYDAIMGANVTPTTFYNIGDLELQDNLARFWVDIGTDEPLLLDVLVNALYCISSDYVGIKMVVFGGSEFQNWKENVGSEDAGYSIHRI
ncbi:uncharacterized protein LOC110025455 isoform X4 [Phalaenopsis equestris]|uniref:uncharacterized protein LOC110025455 isoform X4 n=1 Tax=Phalaenopsis equestris TaxID=78828 RepID=UPI0009E22BB2|nr:uncharacterized protein LOC110025455 isoform X4 [Phalaenopsis equestris]